MISSEHEQPAGVVEARQRAWVILATCTMTVLSMLDQTIANTALPTIARDVNASAADSIWVINAFQLGLTVSVVPFSTAGDILGYWRLYRWGLIGFVVASLACALSHSLVELSVARFVLGVAGGALTVTASPINRLAFPPNMLGRATGYTAMPVALGAAAGPVVCGAILSVAAWPWLFAINVPIGIGILILSFRVIPKTPGTARPFDWTSAAMSIAVFGLFDFGVDAFSHAGPSPLAIAELAGALAIGVVFIARELRQRLPMFPVDLFSDVRFSLAAFACYASFISQTIAYVALPFALQTIMGYTPLQVGALLLPWLIAAAAMAPISGPLADRYNSSRLAAIGLAVFSIGLAAAVFLGPSASPLDIVWRMTVCGIGYGLFQSPNNRSIQGSVPRDRSGGSQAIQAVARVFGLTSGAVIVAAVFAADPHGSVALGGISQRSYEITMAAATVCSIAAAIASVWRGVLTGSIKLAR